MKKLLLLIMSLFVLVACSDGHAKISDANEAIFSVGNVNITKGDVYSSLVSQRGTYEVINKVNQAVLDAEVEITEDMVTGFTTSKEGKYQVIIKYEGQTFNIEITVYPKGQLLIPDYLVITPSELNVDDIYRELAIMIVKIDNGEVSDDKLEDLIKEVLKDSDLENYCFVLSRALKEQALQKLKQNK